MTFPPVVYAGPSISREEVLALLPGATIQGPIRRGDLYRDRMLLHSVFVILDGVFFQNEAISPRECVDVCRDGATVFGASSMGALRAAECCVAGMSGAGVVFRMFRAGILRSDDEVAVTFDPDDPRRGASVPLVNVRYAVSRAVREGKLARETAVRVVESAATLFYPERRWAAILSRAGLGSRRRELGAELGRYDLKRLDAERALRKVAALLARHPELCRTAHRTVMPFERTEHVREAAHSALTRELANSRDELLRWVFATGLYREFLDSQRPRESDAAVTRSGPWKRGRARDKKLWEALLASEPVLFRFRAHRAGLARCRERNVRPTSRDVAGAERELLAGHGFDAWDSLRFCYRNDAEAWTTLLAARDEMAALHALRRREDAGRTSSIPRRIGGR